MTHSHLPGTGEYDGAQLNIRLTGFRVHRFREMEDTVNLHNCVAGIGFGRQNSCTRCPFKSLGSPSAAKRST